MWFFTMSMSLSMLRTFQKHTVLPGKPGKTITNISIFHLSNCLWVACVLFNASDEVGPVLLRSKLFGSGREKEAAITQASGMAEVLRDIQQTLSLPCAAWENLDTEAFRAESHNLKEKLLSEQSMHAQVQSAMKCSEPCPLTSAVSFSLHPIIMSCPALLFLVGI